MYSSYQSIYKNEKKEIYRSDCGLRFRPYVNCICEPFDGGYPSPSWSTFSSKSPSYGARRKLASAANAPPKTYSKPSLYQPGITYKHLKPEQVQQIQSNNYTIDN